MTDKLAELFSHQFNPLFTKLYTDREYTPITYTKETAVKLICERRDKGDDLSFKESVEYVVNHIGDKNNFETN